MDAYDPLSFVNLCTMHSRTTGKKKTVSKKEYEQFCEEYIFNAIKGDTFGFAFCTRFNIVDYMLLFERSSTKAQRYIEQARYIQ